MLLIFLPLFLQSDQPHYIPLATLGSSDACVAIVSINYRDFSYHVNIIKTLLLDFITRLLYCNPQIRSALGPQVVGTMQVPRFPCLSSFPER